MNNITLYMDNTEQQQIHRRLKHVHGPEHLAQITTEMAKKIWKMRTTHIEDLENSVWKTFPDTTELWKTLQTHFSLPITHEQPRGPNSWMNEFDNATSVCWKCQCRKTVICQSNLCQTPRCKNCGKTCSVCGITPDRQTDNKRKSPQDEPVFTSSHTMGTQLYEKTEKARFTTPTRWSGKNKVLKELLQTLCTPDDTGAYFRRKSNSDQDQAATTTDDDSDKSVGEEQPIMPNNNTQHTHPDPPSPLPRSTTEGGHIEFRMQVRGWQDKAHIASADHLLTLPDSALLKTMEHSTFPLLIPQHLFPQHILPHQEYGWWYVPTQETDYRA
jgi:hypothetical protein